MSYCSGELSFLPQVENLQYTINRYFNTLEKHNSSEQCSISANALDTISREWKTILLGWHDDHVMQNFEFHGHLLDGIKKLIRTIMKEQLLQTSFNRGRDYRSLLETLLVQLPDNIESLGMLRGLSTNAAVVKACGRDSHVRISYLLKSIPEQNKKLLQSLNQIQELYPDLSSLQTLKKLQRKLHEFLFSIQMNILDSPEISENSTRLFDLSTSIIDTHWFAMEQGIEAIDKLLYINFDQADRLAGS
ncbi:MAG: hypothetical protein ACR2PS_12005 [Pseudomonadales bacterium]